jgi:hypothetical protein
MRAPCPHTRLTAMPNGRTMHLQRYICAPNPRPGAGERRNHPLGCISSLCRPIGWPWREGHLSALTRQLTPSAVREAEPRRIRCSRLGPGAFCVTAGGGRRLGRLR